jgi:integrase/recombinase XerC
MHDQAIVPTATSTLLEVTMVGWIHAKAQKSGSEKTRRAYTDTLSQFRAWLQKEGLDLDSPSEQATVQISFLAQAYAGHSLRGRQVRPATFNHRLAILSSFYEYAKGKQLVTLNPIDGVERSKVQAYAGARPLDQETTQAAFAEIDRQTPQGKRDYALLAVLLQTGRRLQEVASLQLSHLTLSQGKITLSFEHCKGEKAMRDTLPLSVSQALLAWLHAFYGPSLAIGSPGDDRPVWVSLAQGGRAGKSYGRQLGTQAIADVCQKYLGTSKAHRTRHTFSHLMEKAGASVSEIQARLGHESLATTGRYLAQLKQAENRHAEVLASLLGIE